AQNSVNQDPSFRAHGNVDTKMALKVGRSSYLISFSGFSCHGVQKIKQQDQREADFVVEMSPVAWDKFVAGRRNGDGLTLAELDTIEGVVTADPRKKLEFYRYHLSLQAFLDAGSLAA
ncbi:MAG: hypothetical protein O7B25_02580, partial [Gammaproteobacteria bacterium]|nr:hypothetical protein [Gammaproteobacteria bacterium]